MHDLPFLQNLKGKLSQGNRRSIYLNALPGNLLSRLDALQLEQLAPNLPLLFLDKLLDNPKFDLPLSYNQPTALHQLNAETQKTLLQTAKRLDALLYENRDHRSEYGTEPFGFGFPILLRRDAKQPDKIIKAPVFIWSLNIEKIISKSFAWQLSRNDNMPLYINPVLLAHLENDIGINLQNLRQSYGNDGFISRQSLADATRRTSIRRAKPRPLPQQRYPQTHRHRKTLVALVGRVWHV